MIHLTTDEIVDAYIMRLILESTAGRLAAHNITSEQIRDINEIIEQTRGLVTLEDMSTQRQLNKKFHMAIVFASGNTLLTRLYEAASNLFPDWMLYEYMFRHPELLQSSLRREYQEHKAIADAITQHNADQAAQKIVEHIRNLGNEFESFLNIPGEFIREKEQQAAPVWMAKSITSA